jgi:hypothetical protein
VDVAEIDVLSDAELLALGIVRADLPPGIALYRPSGASKHGPPRNADFAKWADSLPGECRAAIVAVDTGVQLRGDAALGLAAAAERLAADGRRLVLSGISPAQFEHLDEEGVVPRIGFENICPDLEFAISHALITLADAPGSVPAVPGLPGPQFQPGDSARKLR